MSVCFADEMSDAANTKQYTKNHHMVLRCQFNSIFYGELNMTNVQNNISERSPFFQVVGTMATFLFIMIQFE